MKQFWNNFFFAVTGKRLITHYTHFYFYLHMYLVTSECTVQVLHLHMYWVTVECTVHWVKVLDSHMYWVSVECTVRWVQVLDFHLYWVAAECTVQVLDSLMYWVVAVLYNTAGGLSVPKQGFLNPFYTTRGLSTLLAGFAYRKMDLRTQNGLCEPLPEARYMMKSEF